MTKEFLENASWFDFGNKVSKIQGRHNYQVSICRALKTVTVGYKTAMREIGLSCPTISEIKNLKLLWAAFTYKKDLLVLLKALQEQNYQIRWI
jgi:hypothetical protein